MRWIAAPLVALGLFALLGCHHDINRRCRSQHGLVGHTVYECPRHAAATSDRPGVCAACSHPLVGSCREDWSPACMTCRKSDACDGDCERSNACKGKGECGGKCEGSGECKGACDGNGEGKGKTECEGGCEGSCTGATAEGNCGKCSGAAAHPCCGKCAKAKTGGAE